MDIDKIKNIKTNYIGKNIYYYKEITSTHTVAKNEINKLENGAVLIAEVQTQGIGTKGRAWYTGIGKNIAITIILKPKCDVSSLDKISVKIAEVIKDAIFELYKIKLEIKEPNDLLLNNKKICGILPETNTIGDKVNYLIISFGFNVNETDFSDEIKDVSTSLKQEYKKDFAREEIIANILERMEILIEKL